MQSTSARSHALRACLAHALIILPAIALGVWAMLAAGVSPALWGQQIAAFVVFAPLGLIPYTGKKVPSAVFAALMLLALAATLLFPAVGGAKRWLDLGLFNVNAGMLVLPSLLVLLSYMPFVHPVLIAGALPLCMQPDISQLAAFVLGALPLLWQQRRHIRWSAATLLLLLVCLIRCAMTPTVLEPVAYCEGVLALLGNVSPLLQVLGTLSLVLIPASFICRFLTRKSLSTLCLALYYAAALLFSITGQYPVMFMGFGISPIAGYFLAHGFTQKAQRHKQPAE